MRLPRYLWRPWRPPEPGGNNIQIDVDYDTANPWSMFNLRVTEFVDQGGQMVPGRAEVHRNLTLNSSDGSYAVDAVNAVSELIRLAPAGGAVTGSGTSVSGDISPADLTAFAALAPQARVRHRRPGPLRDLTVGRWGGPSNREQHGLAINLLHGTVAGSGTASTITITSNETTSKSAIHFINASTNDAAGLLHLGIANGGIEVDGAASFRLIADRYDRRCEAAVDRPCGHVDHRRQARIGRCVVANDHPADLGGLTAPSAPHHDRRT